MNSNKYEDRPVIKFMRGPLCGGFFSDATPSALGGCGVPIPEHKELYEKYKKEGIKMYYTIVDENDYNKFKK